MAIEASLKTAIDTLYPIVKSKNGGKICSATYKGEVLTDDIYVFINIGTKDVPNYQPLIKDLSSRESSIDKETDTETFLHDYGATRDHHKGASKTITITEMQYIGDVTADYIWSKRYAIGEQAETQIAMWNSLNGTMELFEATINITSDNGGDPGSRNEVNVEIKSAGAIDISESYVPVNG